MRGRGRKVLFQRGDQGVVHEVRAAIPFSGMNRLEGDRVNSLPGGVYPADRLAVVGHALQPAAGQHLLGRHGDQLVLE